MARVLTAAAIRKYRGGRARRELRDGGATGLYLVIQPSGHKSWALRYRRPSGVPAKLTLGPVAISEEQDSQPVLGAPLTLASARALAADQLRKRATGVDVAANYLNEKRRTAEVRTDAAANTFAALARRFIEQYAKTETRRWRGTAKYLGFDYPKDGTAPTLTKGGLAERWRDRPVKEITGDDLHVVVDEALNISIPGLKRSKHRKGPSNTQGRALASVLSTLFGWLVQHRHITAANPALGMFKPPMPKARDRVLNVKPDIRRADELRFFWSACDEVGAPFGQLLRLLLLTGCRLNELAAAQTTELSDDSATLRLPASRTKNHRPHDVYLAPLARTILASVQQRPPYVFSTDGKTRVASFSQVKRRLDAIMLAKARTERGADDAVIAPWRLHDLRRTCATGMAGIGIAPHIIEAALNHVSGAKAGVAGTYNRELYESETRDAWERWSERVEALVTGQTAQVVKLHPRGGAA